MNFRLHSEAEKELNLAVAYYEQRLHGLSLEFAEEVYGAIARILKFPDAWSRLSENTRRCLVNRFPYGIIYQIKFGEIQVIAITHLHRRPGYWKSRTRRRGK